MSVQAKIMTMLPKRLRDGLNDKLCAEAFSDYCSLEEWLAARGFTISRSAIQRDGDKCEQRMQAIALATSEAQAITAAAPDRENAVALASLVQSRLAALLMDTNLAEKDLLRIAREIADLGAHFLQAPKAAVDGRLSATEPEGGLTVEEAANIRAALISPADAGIERDSRANALSVVPGNLLMLMRRGGRRAAGKRC